MVCAGREARSEKHWFRFMDQCLMGSRRTITVLLLDLASSWVLSLFCIVSGQSTRFLSVVDIILLQIIHGMK